jgi:hypothetical protein
MRAQPRLWLLPSRHRPAHAQGRHVSARHAGGRHASRPRRRGPSRLTLGVAGATFAAVAGVSVGVAVAEPAPAVSASPPAHGQPQDRPSTTAPGRSHAQPSTGSTSAEPAKQGATPAPSKSAAPAALGSRQRTSQSAAHAKPYLFYDSLIPSAVPAGSEIATYADGAHPVSPAAVAGRGHVLWIDVTGGDPRAPVLDVEPGNASPSIVASWVTRRLAAAPSGVAIIYTMRAEWPAAQAAVATLPAAMRARVRWWIADPTGYAHIVPGSDATQWYWGTSYDISTANPDFERARTAA